MMHTATDPDLAAAPAIPAWLEASIAVELDDARYLLDDGRLALQAASCLIRPAAGDRVLVAACRDGDNYIVHLLLRVRGGAACLSVPGASRLAIQQDAIELAAVERIALRSLADVDVTAAGGVLSLNARNLFTTVTESLVQNVLHHVANVGHYLLEAKQMLRLHGRHATITADEDVKVDGERISMG
jgi:hypothetical protein